MREGEVGQVGDLFAIPAQWSRIGGMYRKQSVAREVLSTLGIGALLSYPYVIASAVLVYNAPEPIPTLGGTVVCASFIAYVVRLVNRTALRPPPDTP